jgi:GMP synthase (glutamine-hydrolysing)
MDRIVVLDFGGQTAQLISRRIRDCSVYSQVFAGDSRADEYLTDETKGIVLSGSPYSIYEKDAPIADDAVYASGLPILGICYGFHQIVRHYGGDVAPRNTREFGRAPVRFSGNNASTLFSDVPDGFGSWMSHGDSIASLPNGFTVVATSENFIAAAASITSPNDAPVFGIQFHPEVTHCEYGDRILQNFALRICNARADWNVDRYLDEAERAIKESAGNREVLLLISGGVDSTVVAGLLLRSLDPVRVHLMYIDTGLMRKDETAEVTEILSHLGARNLYIIDAADRFYRDLAGIEDPEEKRRVIGDAFIAIQQEEVEKRGVHGALLAQGTLYTDMIESGRGVGRKANVIKSHHNVRSPLVEKKRDAGELIEPLCKLYKDEVRKLGRRIGIDENVIKRHPFPGPGLAVRIIGSVSRERCDLLREADAIFISELKARNLYDGIWQAFCVLLPIQSVGVTGDTRNYGDVLALRAITSTDAMTADVYTFEMRDLLEISSLITNSIRGIGRVVYDVSSKPPATIEWE